MKICTICNQSYPNDQQNFCLVDGGMLVDAVDDAPPTIMLDRSRTTNPTNFANQPGWADPAKTRMDWNNQPAAPISPWQGQPLNQTNQQFMSPMAIPGRNQTLPIVALVFGILALPLICCHGGLYFGIPAAIIGYIGLNNANNNPEAYSGRGMALAGMILGGIGVIMAIVYIVFIIFASIIK